MAFDNFYNGKRVLITGHTGFKGSWLTIWLKELGADVLGYALNPYTQYDNFVCAKLKKNITHIIGDIQNYKKLYSIFSKFKPEIVFHLAAQALVRDSYLQPKETYDINVGGTVNVLECARLNKSVRVIINCTTDKCYENREITRGYRENDRLGGKDPYSSSKACSELITTCYRKSFFDNSMTKYGTAISSVRSGNVIGGGDWRKDRLVPDCIRALKSRKSINVRNSDSIRPWQFVLEPVYGYLLLANKMYQNPKKFSSAWNFGPENSSMLSVGEIVDKIINNWGSGGWKKINELNAPHEAGILRLDITKAKKELSWKPVLKIDDAVKFTVDWYKKPNITYEDCVAIINKFYTKIGGR